MELWLAALLFMAALAGLIASIRGLRQRKALRIICIALCALLALVLAAYIGLTLLFVDAVQHQPPAS